MIFWILGYLVLGIVIAEFTCPWMGLETILAALFWPVTLVVGLFLLIRELRRPPTTMMDLEFTILMGLMLSKLQEVKVEEKREDWRWN